MDWNYRLIEHDQLDGDPIWAVHEVFYEDDGTPIGCTDEAIEIMGDSESKAFDSYRMMEEAFRKDTLKMSYFIDMEKEENG